MEKPRYFFKNNILVAILLAGVILSLIPIVEAQGKNAESEYITIESGGRKVQIRITYPFSSKVEGVVVWMNVGERDSFIPDVARRYYDVRATMRGALFKARYASAEYIPSAGISQEDAAVDVIKRLKQIRKLDGKKIALLAFGDECVVAAKACCRLKDIIDRMTLVSPLLDNSPASMSQHRLYEALKTEKVNYDTRSWNEERLDSLNRASSLDAEYSGDVLSRLLFVRQHEDPLDSIAASCKDIATVMEMSKSYLLDRWDKENIDVKNFWRMSSENYCHYFLKGLTAERIAFLQTNMKTLYGGINCPLMYIYGQNDVTMDVDENVRLMSTAIGKSSLGVHDVKQVVLEGYNHDLKQSYGERAGSVEPEVVVAIVSWITGRKLVLKVSRAKKVYDRLKAFGLSLGGYE